MISGFFLHKWLWIAFVLSVVLSILFVQFQRTRTPPRIVFFKDVFLVWLSSFLFLTVLLYCFSSSMDDINKIAADMKENIENKAWVGYVIPGIILSGFSAFFLGFALFFKREISILNRVLLTLLSVCPFLFGFFLMFLTPGISNWFILKISFKSSIPAWIINVGIIFTGKSFYRFMMAALSG
mgnify:CR=1 FL=1